MMLALPKLAADDFLPPTRDLGCGDAHDADRVDTGIEGSAVVVDDDDDENLADADAAAEVKVDAAIVGFEEGGVDADADAAAAGVDGYA